MEAETHQTNNNKKINNTSARTGLIDGLPNSYNTVYVTEHDKTCGCCSKYITKANIQKNEVVCIEASDFYHKKCLTNENIEYTHMKENDKSSIASFSGEVKPSFEDKNQHS